MILLSSYNYNHTENDKGFSMLDSKLYKELKYQLLRTNSMIYIINCFPAEYITIHSDNFRTHQNNKAIMKPNPTVSSKNLQKYNIPNKISTETHSLTKTSKIVIRNNLYCKNCFKRASYVFECKYKDKPKDQKPILIFAIYENNTLMLLTKDHIKPKALGGTNGYENLQCLCEDCNLEKGHRYDEEDRQNHIKTMNTYENEKVADFVVPAEDKIKHFRECRKLIKSSIANLPWYYKLLGVDKYLYNKLKKPLIEHGYFQEGIGVVNKDSDE